MKVAAVSRKMNTTTHEVLGVMTKGHTQIVRIYLLKWINWFIIFVLYTDLVFSVSLLSYTVSSHGCISTTEKGHGYIKRKFLLHDLISLKLFG